MIEGTAFCEYILRISAPTAWWLVFLSISYYGYEFLLRLLPRLFDQDLIIQFNLNPIDIGLIASLYYYSYSMTQLIVGPALDKWGPKKVLSLSTLLCALSLGLVVCWPSFTSFCLSRVFIGFASAFAFVGILKTADLYLPEKYNSFVAGLGTTIGMLSAQIGANIIAHSHQSYTWIEIIQVLIAAGGIIFILIYCSYPTFNLNDDNQQQGEQQRLKFSEIKKILLKPSILSLGVIGGLIMVVTQMFEEVYGSIYCQSLELNLTPYQISHLLGYIYYGWIIAAPAWGSYVLKTKSRIELLTYSQFAVAVLLALLISISLLPGQVVTITAMRALFLILGICSAPQVLVFALASEQAPKKYRATALAAVNCLVSVMAALLPALLSLIQQLILSFNLLTNQQTYIASLGFIVVFLLVSAITSRKKLFKLF